MTDSYVYNVPYQQNGQTLYYSGLSSGVPTGGNIAQATTPTPQPVTNIPVQGAPNPLPGEVQQGYNASALTWDLSPWTSQGNQFTSIPKLTINGKTSTYTNPNDYINALTGLKQQGATGNLNQFISEFQKVVPNFSVASPAPSVPATTPARVPVTLGNGQQVFIDAQGNATDTNGNPVSNATISASTAGSTVSPSSNIPSSINSSILAPSTPINVSMPNYTPPPTIPDVPAMQLTPQEAQASDLTKQLQALNDSLVGKSAYQTQQNTAAGVDQIQQAINDNSTAIKQLQNEAKAIPLQIQQDALGRGQTAGGIAPIQAGQLRENAIKGLTLSSISDALANNLVAAQHKADQAVAAKYGPLEEELKAKTANLDLILKDPATTLAEQNRANAQQALIDAQKSAIDEQKTNMADVLKTAHDAATNAANFIATTQYPTLSFALNAIANAKTPAEALSIQAATGLNPVGSKTGTTNKTQIIGDAAAGYSSITTDANGNIISNTPVKAGTGVKLSAADKTSNALSAFSQAFTAGKKMADGTPTVDSNGYITPVAWKAAIADAPAEGLTRADFIKQFGSMLYTTKDSNGADVVDNSYGLTTAEQKLITGAITP